MHWLIDGHNLIGHMPSLGLDDPHDEEKLVEHLRRYQARTGHRLTVVFDSGQAYRPAETQKQGRLTVKYVSRGQTADQLIIRRLRRVKNPQAVIVVTSDREVQEAARQKRVRVVTSQEFAAQLFQPPGGSGAAEDHQADIKLSPEEVEAWLAIFNESKP